MRNAIKILLFLLIPVLGRAQMHYTDSLKNILKMAKADSMRYSALNGIGEFYVEINADSAIYYLDKAFFIAKKNNRDLNEAMTLARKGYVFGHQGKYAEALSCFQESLDLASDQGTGNGIWNPNMPWIRISTPAKSRLTILAGIHLLYGILMRITGDSIQGIKQLKISRDYATKAGDINFVGIANMNLGNSYYKGNHLDSALMLEKDAERISKLTGYTKYLPFIQLTLGNIYLKKGNGSLALQYYHKALNTSIGQKTVTSTDNAYFYLAAYYLARHQKDSSLYYAKKRLEIVRYMHSNEFSQAYESLYQSYQLANQVDSAYKYQGLALAARDSDYKSTVKNLADYQKLSFKEQIRSQELEKEKEDTRARIRTYALLAVIVVILIVAFIIYRNSRQRKKANYLLFEQKEEIAAQRDNLENKNRELEVETALEKVRTVAMAMQHPDDMLEVCRNICGQLVLLGIAEIRNVQTAIIYEARGIYINYEYYSLYEKTFITEVDYGHPIQADFVKKMLVDGGYQHLSLKGKELKDWYEYQKTTNQFVDTHLAEAESLNYYWYSIGPVALGMSMYKQVTEDELALFRRFMEVFRLAYSRYKDIELAMAQAREAQIELALERVRARTMAMQHSDELAETAYILFQQFKELGENPDQATIGIINEEEWVIDYWVTMYGSQTNKVFKFSIDEPNVTRRIYDGWKAHEKSLVIDLKGKELYDFSNYRASMGGAAFNPDEQHRVVNVAFFSKGLINVQSKESRPAESVRLLERFAAVFEQSYTRFLDLQKAEAQAREAIIESALERMRSKTMAMHSSNDVAETVAGLFSELVGLGIEKGIRSGIGIINDNAEMEVWTAYSGDDEQVGLVIGRLDMTTHGMLQAVFNNWKAGKSHSSYTLEGDDQKAYYTAINNSDNYSFKFDIETLPEKHYQNAFYFKEGIIYVFSLMPLTAEEVKIFSRFAGVFGLTYTRFLDLQKAEASTIQAQEDLVKLQTEKRRAENALTELQAAQTQLVQREKMASLGELTAGIAHEIQNPLNFVNNFSEVNREMLEELDEELNKGDIAGAKNIAADIRQNEEKINHHGKRADFIVKGMLLHSRNNTGEKEATDINAMANEFLKLSYYGLRAKDKSFNAELVTNFDKNLPKVIIAHQDIGRVLLNLFNNAFYAVNQKQKNAGADYKPEVAVSTFIEKNNLIITVKDNGNGIPDTIKDKIMQPFFTTKPTGEGTGLGLSLSYDIVVKGHRGSIQVNSVEGECSEFIVQLPLS